MIAHSSSHLGLLCSTWYKPIMMDAQDTIIRFTHDASAKGIGYVQALRPASVLILFNVRRHSFSSWRCVVMCFVALVISSRHRTIGNNQSAIQYTMRRPLHMENQMQRGLQLEGAINLPGYWLENSLQEACLPGSLWMGVRSICSVMTFGYCSHNVTGVIEAGGWA